MEVAWLRGHGAAWDTASAMERIPRHRGFLRRAAISSEIDAVKLIMSLYSSVVERQSCKLKILGSIPSGGFDARFECDRARGLVLLEWITDRGTSSRSTASCASPLDRSKDGGWPFVSLGCKPIWGSPKQCLSPVGGFAASSGFIVLSGSCGDPSCNSPVPGPLWCESIW